MKQILESRTKVRFQDCDPYNHLNNGKYVDYMLNAREDQMINAYNLNIYDMALKDKKAWVVASTQIAYISPAFTMEEVVIESQLIGFGKKDLTVEIRMFDKSKTQIKSFVWMNFVYFDLRTQQAIEQTEELFNLFEAVILPLEQKNFQERNLFFRTTKKELQIEKKVF